MKYLRPYKLFESEDKSFGERDMTNLHFEEGQWIRWSDDPDWYGEIERDFGITCDDIGFILMDFVEKYDLLYSCSPSRSQIHLNFYPNSMILDKKDYKEWIYDHTVGSLGSYYINYEPQTWEWDSDILDEMESRFNEHGLTIKTRDKTMIYINTSVIEISVSKIHTP